MKIAVLGSGGREHALTWKLAQSMPLNNIYTIPGNGGTPNNVPLNPNDFDALHQFCIQENIELIFVGPEAPLVNGIVDYFANTNIQVFGPSKAAAQLEGSKIWAKQFMRKHGVATADFWLPKSITEAKAVIQQLHGNLVLKYDGLAGGKGVFVCASLDEAYAALNSLQEKYGTSVRYLIERKLTGPEISIIGFTDGKHIKLLPPSQDHKQLLDGDKGPNTGGMGAYCPVPFCTEELLANITENIVNPTLQGIQADGLVYKGIIYFGIMVSSEGPKLLEYNARFGDPETEVLLPALKSDLLELIQACLQGDLATYELHTHDAYFVDVVLTSGGYPKKYVKGYPITGIEKVNAETLVFHAGTQKTNTGEVVSNGGRVLNVVTQGKTLQEAIKKVYTEVANITFTDVYYRKDIGQRPLP